MISLDFSGINLRLQKTESKTNIFDPIRKKWVILTPEEHVRQYILQYLLKAMNYPSALVAVERKFSIGNLNKRFDVVVYNREHLPWMLVECKAPEVPVTEQTLRQLLNYQGVLQCDFWLLTNGHQTYCADARNKQEIIWLDSLPVYQP